MTKKTPVHVCSRNLMDRSVRRAKATDPAISPQQQDRVQAFNERLRRDFKP